MLRVCVRPDFRNFPVLDKNAVDTDFAEGETLVFDSSVIEEAVSLSEMSITSGRCGTDFVDLAARVGGEIVLVLE